MRIMVNGETREVAGGAVSLSDYLFSLTLKSQLVVVECNGVIVPRDDFAVTLIQEGDTLEIVQMMAGG